MSSRVPRPERRMRARKACEPCRERKRKCDGHSPCGPCVRFEYACRYVSVRQIERVDLALQHKAAPVLQTSSAHSTVSPEPAHPQPAADTQLRSVEANSGAAFVRKLALALDPDNAPRLHLFAWNLFLGSRTSGYLPKVQSIVDIVSDMTMESLAAIYLAKVDPCYGFIDHEMLQQRMQSRWHSHSTTDSYDAVLCGIAALGLLYSCNHVENIELDLVETAKYILEQSPDAQPNIDIVSGWVLRVAYLRMTATPHTAWLASCTMMHIIEASGIHSAKNSIAFPDTTAELCSRVVGIARHLNVWISFDIGRSRVVLPHINLAKPCTRSGDYTTEILSLLPVSENLDPGKNVSISGLRDSLQEVLKQNHSEPPSVLAQCNLVLCIARRLRALDLNISGDLLEQMLALTSRSIHCAQAMLSSCNPWNQVANVPFQIVCILLAIDSASSIAQLGDAIRALSNADHVYNTDATKEALNTACLLALLHQKRKAADARYLGDTIQTYSPSLFIDTLATSVTPPKSAGLDGFTNTLWFDDLMAEYPRIQDFDVGQLLNENGQLDLSAEWYHT